ncbi:hypothetical protein T484DRAFT_1838021 [Baffinella frigidus]|nr:hypothetical protein T484DRAFT_1838021 [Cryptophyta sp. CCMP2293]
MYAPPERPPAWGADRIACVAVDGERLRVATGEARSKSLVFVWNLSDGAQLAEINVKGRHDKGISALGFSHDGSRLVSVGADDDNKIYIWDWAAGKEAKPLASEKGGRYRMSQPPCKEAKPLASEKGGRYRIVSVVANPFDSSNGPEGTFVTGGRYQIVSVVANPFDSSNGPEGTFVTSGMVTFHGRYRSVSVLANPFDANNRPVVL